MPRKGEDVDVLLPSTRVAWDRWLSARSALKARMWTTVLPGERPRPCGTLSPSSRRPAPERMMMPRPLFAHVAVNDGVQTSGHDRDAHVDVDDEAADRHERRDRVDERRHERSSWSSHGTDATNHITSPETSSARPPQTISQNSIFCP